MSRAQAAARCACSTDGDPDGVPLVAHHGTPGSRLLYRRWVEDAAERGIRLIGYDRPGYGGSDRDPGRSVADAAADVAAIADALGLDRILTHGRSGRRPARARLRGPARRSGGRRGDARLGRALRRRRARLPRRDGGGQRAGAGRGGRGRGGAHAAARGVRPAILLDADPGRAGRGAEVAAEPARRGGGQRRPRGGADRRDARGHPGHPRRLARRRPRLRASPWGFDLSARSRCRCSSGRAART